MYKLTKLQKKSFGVTSETGLIFLTTYQKMLTSAMKE